MNRIAEDPEIEDRILMEIVVDAYDESERAIGWYCYLERAMTFPFNAVCIARRSISPLKARDRVQVLGLAEAELCDAEVFVTIRWDADDELAVPLAQLRPLGASAETSRAAADWRYWVGRGYRY